jgi:adenine-specific DNA-methyltransferase
MPPTKDQKKATGQYFTVATALQDWIWSHTRHKGAHLLEPSAGAGHLLRPFLAHNPAYPFTAVEIDGVAAANILPSAPATQRVIVGDFLTQPLGDAPFKTIIANPPFVAQRGKPNLYLQFLTRCYDLVDPDAGELLMIVPSDFFKLTSAAPLLRLLVSNGAFTDVWFPHDEGLFPGAAIDVVLFRYERGATQGLVRVNDTDRVLHCADGIVTFTAPQPNMTRRFGDLFNVYVGIVSGRDEIYRQSFGSATVLTDFDRIDRFIIPTEYPTGNQQIDSHLLAHKTELKSRQIRRFNETNWWQWGALRNYSVMTHSHVGKPCIYVRTITRKPEIARLGTVQPFGGGLLCCIPKGTGHVDLTSMVAAIQATALPLYTQAGRFKIGQRQLCELQITLS